MNDRDAAPPAGRAAHDESPPPGTSARDEQSRIVIRDHRRIDPDAGRSRPPAVRTEPASSPDTATAPADPIEQLSSQLAERTADLQRISAEYANYRKRTDRDRESVAALAQAALLGELLPVLDDIDRAEQHGELTGGFKNVADALRAGLERAGLEAFGADGDPFDPNVHEAAAHATSPEVEAATVTAVMRRGYRHGERLLRTALVEVTAPD